MFGELNKAMSGIKLFAVAGEADFGDCALLVDVVVVVVAEGDELSELKRDANLLWKEDMTKKRFFSTKNKEFCLQVERKEKRERERQKTRRGFKIHQQHILYSKMYYDDCHTTET